MIILFLVFQDYKGRVELEFGKKIQVFEVDNGREYINCEYFLYSVNKKVSEAIYGYI